MAVLEAAAFGAAAFEVLVDLEEVLDLAQGVRADVAQVADRFGERVVGCDGDNLLVVFAATGCRLRKLDRASLTIRGFIFSFSAHATIPL